MWGALIGALVSVVGTFAGKALISLGIGYVAYKGIDVSIAYAKAQVFASLGGLSGVTLQLIGVLQIGTGVNILFSALVARLTFKGMVGGVMKAAKLN